MKKLIYLFAITSILFSCESNDDNPSSSSQNDDTFSQNFGLEIQSDFLGRVIDINGNPIHNADIKIGSSTARTDQNGVFIIYDANVFEKFAYITATKTGYINGSRTIFPNSGINRVEIRMIPNTPVAVIQSGQSSEVTLSNQTKVIFDGAFEDLDGNGYTGPVSVSMFHLLPSDENLTALMPGALYAQDSAREQQMLETFGMLNVELKGSNGQKLQIADGHLAIMQMKIDASQMTTAPQTIPLWSFDEAKGYWKEEGVAEKQGNYYEGKVSHFSWWNCDTFMKLAYLTVKVTDSHSIPVTNVKIKLTINSSNFTSNYQNTNNEGLASGQIPADEIINVKVFDICDNLLYNQNVGPYNSSTNNIHEIILNSNIQSVSISGSLISCESNLVTNGYVALEFENQTLFCSVTDGDFSFNTFVCDSENQTFILEGFDFDNLQRSGEINYAFDNEEVIKIGNLPTCNSITEFISFNIKKENSSYNIDEQYIITDNFTFQAASGSQYTITGNYLLFDLPGLSISGPSIVVGNYSQMTSDLGIGVRYFDSNGNMLATSFSSENPSATIQLAINKYGEIGEYIDITFYASVLDSQLNLIEVEGILHVIRDN